MLGTSAASFIFAIHKVLFKEQQQTHAARHRHAIAVKLFIRKQFFTTPKKLRLSICPKTITALSHKLCIDICVFREKTAAGYQAIFRALNFYPLTAVVIRLKNGKYQYQADDFRKINGVSACKYCLTRIFRNRQSLANHQALCKTRGFGRMKYCRVKPQIRYSKGILKPYGMPKLLQSMEALGVMSKDDLMTLSQLPCLFCVVDIETFARPPVSDDLLGFNADSSWRDNILAIHELAACSISTSIPNRDTVVFLQEPFMQRGECLRSVIRHLLDLADLAAEESRRRFSPILGQLETIQQTAELDGNNFLLSHVTQIVKQLHVYIETLPCMFYNGTRFDLKVLCAMGICDILLRNDCQTRADLRMRVTDKGIHLLRSCRLLFTDVLHFTASKMSLRELLARNSRNEWDEGKSVFPYSALTSPADFDRKLCTLSPLDFEDTLHGESQLIALISFAAAQMSKGRSEKWVCQSLGFGESLPPNETAAMDALHEHWRSTGLVTIRQLVLKYASLDTQPLIPLLIRTNVKIQEVTGLWCISIFKSTASINSYALTAMLNATPCFTHYYLSEELELLLRGSITAGVSDCFGFFQEIDKTTIKGYKYANPKICKAIYQSDMAGAYPTAFKNPDVPSGSFICRFPEDGHLICFSSREESVHQIYCAMVDYLCQGVAWHKYKKGEKRLFVGKNKRVSPSGFIYADIFIPADGQCGAVAIEILECGM